MRLKRMIGNSLWAAVLALVIPVTQAQAEDCVTYNGLNHCAKGNAKVSSEGDAGVQVDTDESGHSGVIIHTGLATHWTAGTFTSSDDESSNVRTLLSSVSEGSATSTATIETDGETTTYASTFTNAGEDTTHSVLIYYRGVLRYAAGGLHQQGGPIINEPGPVGPNCRPAGQSVTFCRNTCRSWGYPNCDYCNTPCAGVFSTRPTGSCEWRFQLPHENVRIADQVIQGDEIVFSEEVPGASSYPYLGFDQIHIETTARNLTVTNESVVNACVSPGASKKKK
ncbi:hypothetical protein JY651_17110 [Pyxidicoccus parkwayensis]|uniref:Uncharacterized protein n=1 Tax=Pyxidicoccus parkwayensis TaxID=2813578 RepID=A0ABX7P7V7_9BACT|nr:hypothetical protein [Pyxidicoccus parkwaysis]QSQ26542.1 hypothetical protein JY651_17110 [Pyxidicoccus parkwaysis]